MLVGRVVMWIVEGGIRDGVRWIGMGGVRG